MNSRLRAMQLQVMGITVESAPAQILGRNGASAGDTVSSLRAALLAERQARLAAEARLRGVLAAVARRRPAVPAAPARAPRAAPALALVPHMPELSFAPASVETMKSQIMNEEVDGEFTEVEEG